MYDNITVVSTPVHVRTMPVRLWKFYMYSRWLLRLDLGPRSDKRVKKVFGNRRMWALGWLPELVGGLLALCQAQTGLRSDVALVTTVFGPFWSFNTTTFQNFVSDRRSSYVWRYVGA